LITSAHNDEDYVQNLYCISGSVKRITVFILAIS